MAITMQVNKTDKSTFIQTYTCPCNVYGTTGTDARPPLTFKSNDIILYEQLSKILTAARTELSLRSAPGVLVDSAQNALAKAEDLTQLVGKLERMKDVTGLNDAKQGNIIEKTFFVSILQKLSTYQNECMCNCDYCACNGNYCSCNTVCSCNCNGFCACNCDFCTCNCVYTPCSCVSYR